MAAVAVFYNKVAVELPTVHSFLRVFIVGCIFPLRNDCCKYTVDMFMTIVMKTSSLPVPSQRNMFVSLARIAIALHWWLVAVAL